MLSFEWRELEALCDRIGDLRHRYAAAQRLRHAGLVDGLKTEIAKLLRQRDLLVQHISAHLGSAAGERRHSPETIDRRTPDWHDADPPHETGASTESAKGLPLP
jgi:hypothetical protein